MRPPPPPRTLYLLLLLFLACCEAPRDVNCDLAMITRMPLQVQDHLLVVPAGINGKWARLVVDSGAERTTIGNAFAEQLRLPHDPRYVTGSLGIGGATTTTDVTIDRLVLGDVRFPVTRIAVGNFKLRSERGLVADGLLGADILLAFDMDIDVPGGELTLYRNRVCPNVSPPWQQPWVEVTGVRTRRDRLLLPFDLDNVPGMAILDTGAQTNLVGPDMARRMGLNQQALANDPAITQRGTGPDVAVARLHQFRLLRIGPVAQEMPRITVSPTDFGFGDALVGEEFLQDRRVWLSFRNRQVFVSRRPNE